MKFYDIIGKEGSPDSASKGDADYRSKFNQDEVNKVVSYIIENRPMYRGLCIIILCILEISVVH